MLAARTPQEAYRQVDFDARVAGADAAQLVALCYEQAIRALDSALHAARRGDNRGKSEGLSRALAAITALQLGIDPAAAMAAVLGRFLGAARRAVLDSVPAFDPGTIARIRDDFVDIRAGLGL